MPDSTSEAAAGEKPVLVGDRESAAVSSGQCVDTEFLLDEFRNLSLLVTLTTALNNEHNYSTLDLPDPKRTSSLDKESSVLHAMCHILVLEHEILACMAAGRSDILIVQDGRSLSPQADLRLEEFITEDDGVKYTNDLPPGPIKVTTVANPEKRDPPRKYGHCIAVPPGTNHWNEIHESYADKKYCLVE
jgi:hypothetical protein